jgi:hypothetical protein
VIIIVLVSVIERVCVMKPLMNPIVRTRTRHFITCAPPTHDNSILAFMLDELTKCWHGKSQMSAARWVGLDSFKVEKKKRWSKTLDLNSLVL